METKVRANRITEWTGYSLGWGDWRVGKWCRFPGRISWWQRWMGTEHLRGETDSWFGGWGTLGELKVEVGAEQGTFGRLISSKSVAGVANSGQKTVAHGHTCESPRRGCGGRRASTSSRTNYGHTAGKVKYIRQRMPSNPVRRLGGCVEKFLAGA